ncbi:tetrahydromethanopterin S-methyltransferase subunit H [Candidatus Bathyarchaeota archaeon]|nr:tetrahydromethanopterin S-methyltransferase subunit H [Candidatus Bathyarchaeota archaeon]
MFDYSVKQKTYTIGGVMIGGEPGRVPTVMVGSMFYNKDKTVSDPARGVFNKEKAEKYIRKAEEASEATGLPTMVDLVAENHAAAQRYLDFVVESTSMPIFLDVVSEREQALALRYADEIGVIDRVVLNSVSPHTGPGLYEAVSDVKLRSSVLLTHSTRHVLSSDKSPVLDELVPKAETAGIENILVDTAVLDIPTLGITAKAIDLIKDRYGYPCGCGAHNALSSWRRLKEKYSKDAQTIVKGVTNALPTIIGADYVLFGPLKNAASFYPAVAMVDAAYSQLMMEKRVRPDRSHPRYRIG